MTADSNWTRVKEVFQSAIALPPDDRGAFVERACGQDRGLREEVESLLAAHREAGTFAERPAIERLVDEMRGAVEYQILSPLGAGAMGEVFRARDVALGREVAIKILPPGLAAEPDRLARFDREAHVLASLNHPNICAIYGLTDISGTPGLVLELVEGPTLRERLEADQGRGGRHARRLGIRDALTIGRDIARALEAAHEKGIIHRDLKPANIKITPGGDVKVLDFGLAKAAAESLAERTPVDAGTLPWESQGGLLLGTAAYMSPEQARGEPVDKRADIWAFGAVLYEMLTGCRPARGATLAETLAAVVDAEPDWTAVPPSVPPNVQRLVRRCLEKDPKRRLKDIGDARLELEDALAPGVINAGSGASVQRPVLRWAWPWMLAAGLGLGVVFTVVWPRDTAQGPSPRRVSAQLGTDATLVTFQFGQANAVTLSRDGGTMAFVAQATGAAPRQIYVRRREELQARPISGTDGALNPFFSPDGRWIGFFADAKLKKVPTEGGGAVTICAVPSNRGGAWGEDDRITFAPVRGGAPLWQVSSSPGEPVPVTTLVDDEVTHRWPQMLDGGRTVLFTANSRQDGFQNANIVVQSLPNGPRKVIVPGAYFGRYLPTGHLLYVHDATVFAARFDLDRLESVGTPVPVLEGVTVNAPVGAAEIAFSDEGTVAYLPAPEQVNYMDAPIEWMDRSGKTTTLRPTPVRWLSPRFSRDGRRLAFDVFDGKQADVWIYDVARDGLTRLTIDQGQTPVWTPDASRIAFQSVRGNARVSSLFWQRSDGVGEPQRLTTGARSQRPGSWHPDGRVLAFTEVDAATGTSSIMTLRLDGDEQSGWRPAEPGILQKDGDEPMFSPEGRWLAYSARSSSPVGTDVFIRPFPGTGGPWQISTGGGWNPVWSSRRAELFYSTPDNQIMVTSYSVSGGSFRHDKPRVLPDSRFNRRPGPLSRSFDVHPDGDRFVLAKVPASEAKRDHIIFFYNFFDELRRLAPSGH